MGEGISVYAPAAPVGKISDTGDDFEAFRVEFLGREVRVTVRHFDEDLDRVSEETVLVWDRLTAERIFRAGLAELAATRR